MAENNRGPLGQDEAELARQVLDTDRALTEALEPKMKAALALREAGQNAKAADVLREIIHADPRLPEPRLELAHVAASRDDWEEAQTQARMGVSLLRAGGQWTADLPPSTLLAFAINLLGETVVRPLEEGDLFLVDQPAFVVAWNEAATLFQEAATLDPASEDARRNQARYRPLPQ
jgi:hypothetical protein